MKDLWLSIIYTAARSIAGVMLPRLIKFIMDAQSQFGAGSGPQKLEWVIGRLKEERDFAYSNLASMASPVLAMIVSVVVAQVKTR